MADIKYCRGTDRRWHVPVCSFDPSDLGAICGRQIPLRHSKAECPHPDTICRLCKARLAKEEANHDHA